jgi:hypothetical protein
MIMGRFTLAAVILLAFASHAQAGSTLRCGSALVSLDDSAPEVAQKCGEPASRVFVGYQEAPGYGGRYNQMPIEEWVYGPNNGMYQRLRFIGNRLTQIDSKRGQ